MLFNSPPPDDIVKIPPAARAILMIIIVPNIINDDHELNSLNIKPPGYCEIYWIYVTPYASNKTSPS